MPRPTLEKLCLSFELNKASPTVQKHEPHYFYHVSIVPLGDTDGSPNSKVKMKPRLIHSGESEISHIHRICVAPSVEQAINACAQDMCFTNELYIYRTSRKISNTYAPYGVFDAPITGERWLMRQTSFELVGKVKFDMYGIRYGSNFTSVNYNNRGGWSSLKSQRLELPRVRKFFRKHGKNIFFNDKNYQINIEQAKNTFNRSLV